MPLLPIRNLGAAGVITDVDPFNLPFNAFTRAKNVRFSDGNVERSPVFRTAYDYTSSSTKVPSFVFGLSNPGTFDTVLIVNDDFSIDEFSNGTVSSVHTDTQSPSPAPVTGTTLASVEYLNRPSRVPIARTPTASTFSTLANWDSTWRTSSLRSFGDFMLALGLTEGSTSYPNRIRFSDITLANQVPGSWDATDTTKSAGFNDLVQLRTPIVDGATLGSNFLIYSSDQVWNMEFVGGTFIFNFRKVFDDAGVINQNCILEVEGKHFVFDTDDIYMNDGITRQSICDNRVRDYIFNGIDMSLQEACFVMHVADLEEIYFCYHTGDDLAVYDEVTGCNRAAVYNYRSDTWSFVDLPNVTSGSLANLDTVATYATTGLTYDSTGGTYHAQESKFTRYPVMVSKKDTTAGITSPRLLGLDLVDSGSLNLPETTEVNKPMYLERTGIDLDQEAQLPISSYKVINKIFPQITTPATEHEFTFTFGAADLAPDAPAYGSSVTFDNSTDHKLDTRIAGRYLSYKVETPTIKDFTLSGMDVNIVPTGRR
jgi:hypothetical protein